MRRYLRSLLWLVFAASFPPIAVAQAAQLGASPATAARSVDAIVDSGAAGGPGLYWIDPDGPGGERPYQAYVEMPSRFVSRYTHQKASLRLQGDAAPLLSGVEQPLREASSRRPLPIRHTAAVSYGVKAANLAEELVQPEAEDTWAKMKQYVERGASQGFWDSPGEAVLAWVPVLYHLRFYTPDGRFAFEPDGRVAAPLSDEQQLAAREQVEKDYANHGHGMTGATGGEQFIAYVQQRLAIARRQAASSPLMNLMAVVGLVGAWGVWSYAADKRPREVAVEQKQAIRPIHHRRSSYRQKLYRSDFFPLRTPPAVAFSGRTAVQGGRIRMLPRR